MRRFAVAVLGLIAVAAPLVVDARPSAAAGTRYLDRVFESVEVTHDVVYRTPQVAANDGVLDVYEPSGDTATERPLVVWLHGSGAASSDKADSLDTFIATQFAQHGAVAVSINYDVYNRTGGASDARAAVAFMRRNAAKFRIDTGRIAMAGMSAGAYTMLDAAFLPDITAGEPPADQRAQAVISLAGSGPGFAVQPGEPPIFMAHGTQDTNAPYADAVKFCSDANTAGVPCEFHSFDADHIGLLAHANEIETLMSLWLYDTLDLADAQDPPRDTTTTTTSTTVTTSTTPPADEPAPPADPVDQQPNLAG